MPLLEGGGGALQQVLQDVGHHVGKGKDREVAGGAGLGLRREGEMEPSWDPEGWLQEDKARTR